MSERWGDSQRDRTALDRWLTDPHEEEFYAEYAKFHLKHGTTDTQTDDNFVTRILCLACADGDHHVCYGEQCRCYCGGEEV